MRFLSSDITWTACIPLTRTRGGKRAEELTRDGTIARMEDELRQETKEVRQRRTSDSDCLQSPSEASERRSRLMAGKEVSGHGTDPARAA